MRNFSITNLEQSKRLYYAGLKLSTADYLVESSIKKVDGVMNVTEKPIKVEAPSDLDKAENNQYYSAAWSLGKLIHMMHDTIPSAYDEDGNSINDDEPFIFNLDISRNTIKYIDSDGHCRLSAYGSCLLDAAVEMTEKLLKDEYFVYSED